MRWQDKVGKRLMKHVRESTDRPTLQAVRKNIEVQHERGIVCWECRAISIKLGIPYSLPAQHWEEEAKRIDAMNS